VETADAAQDGLDTASWRFRVTRSALRSEQAGGSANSSWGRLPWLSIIATGWAL